MSQVCRKCGGAMRAGVAIAQTVDCSDEGTMSPAGPGALINCLKCEVCGWSVTKPRAQMDDEELELLTGEPHIDGWPLESGLPPAASPDEKATGSQA